MFPASLAFVLVLAQASVPAVRTRPAVARAERAWAGADVLLPLARSHDRATATAAIRALGRLQDRTLVPRLLEMENSSVPAIRSAAAAALAQTLIGIDPRTDGDLIAGVVDRLLRHREWRALARIALPDARRASAVDEMLADVLRRTASAAPNAATHGDAAIAFESFVRRNSRLTGFSLLPASRQLLESIVLGRQPNDTAAARRYAFWTLMQARATTGAVLESALDDRDEQTRRLAVQALGSTAAATLAGAERTRALERALKDRSVIVRVEAVRSYGREATSAGACAPLLDALADDAPHVVNTALDVLTGACPQDAMVTDRLAREAVAPEKSAAWQRPAHALVALASRDHARAAEALPSFAAHPVWEVRMYAARAAATVNDEAVLARLARDDSDNVRSAALPPLHALSAERARPAIIAALARSDFQLLRTAAALLKGDPPSRPAYAALIGALQRVTKEQKETSRDARLPILDAIAVHGTPADSADLVPLLADIDPRIAERAEAILHDWGRVGRAAPRRADHDGAAAFTQPSTCVAVEMASGRTMRIEPDAAAAPVTSERFLNLALDRHFYDGLTFHRVEPNFVIQGGSSGANEYSSNLDRYLRDEIGLPNVRGAVGLSTRGLNTADGQIYLLLVDEPRLDGRFTIFAHVFDTPEDMRTLDGIQEGDAIARVESVRCR